MSLLPSVASTSTRSAAVAAAAASPARLLHLRRYQTSLGPIDLAPRKKTPSPVYDPARTVLGSSPAERPQWNPMSQRSGTIMTKIGMTAVWDTNGVRVPCTVLQLEDCQVTQVIPPRQAKLGRPDFTTLQVGAFNLREYEIDPVKRQALGLAPTRKRNPFNAPANYVGHFLKHEVPPKKVVQEFRVSDDAILPVGAKFSVAHYVPGQHVDVQSTSIGKGTAGVMKRWGFGGGNASHGASKDHRSAGSTGQNQDPGRSFPGKKKAGHLGAESATQHNLLVQRIDLSLSLVFVKGCVPGPPGAVVRVTDALMGVIGAGRKALRAGKGEGELLKDVATLPFPMGDDILAESLPMVVDAAPRPLPPGQGSLY